jgi:outer membrane protein TolC
MLLAVPLLSILVSAAAAAPAGVPVRPDSALADVVAGLPGEPLALDDAIRQGLDGATGVRSARAALRSARGALRREKGAFDPVLFADVDVTDADTPTASPFSGADVLETKERSVSTGARLKLPIGTELAAILETVRLETNSSFASLNPQHTTSGRLTVRQPLLSGFGPSANAGVSSASRDLDAARARATDAALSVASEVEATYWDLHAAELDLAVRRLLVQRGESFVHQAVQRAEAGVVGPGEVATARTFLAEQQIEAIAREEDLDETSDRLATLLGRRPAGGATRFRTVSEPPGDFALEPEEALVERALARNHELRAAKADLAAADARARAAAWDRLPRLDVSGSIGGNGLAGTGRSVAFLDTTFTTQSTGGFSDSFDQVVNRDFLSWSVGMSLEVPLTLRPGRGERERTLGEVDAAQARVEAVRRDVEDQVRARRRELEHGSRRLELARTGVDAALEQARIGQIEYQNGRSTAFELVRLAADVAAAQQRYSDALVRTAKAAAELKRLAPVETNPGSEE